MMFKTPFQRPTSISDPSGHLPAEHILQMPNQEMGWSEFRAIFHFGVLGTFEELAYFLPFALEYMVTNPNDALEFMNGVIFFISDSTDELKQASLLEPCRDGLSQIFHHWTNDFKVVHYDKDACKAKGWILEYDDIVENSQVVCELIDELWRHKTHKDLADHLIKSLADGFRNEIKSAWLLEYAYRTRSSYEFWDSARGHQIHEETVSLLGMDYKSLVNEKSNVPTKASTIINNLVFDSSLLQKHYDFIADTIVPNEPSPTYWSTIRKGLALRD
jgi:hypothetical protein